MIDLNALESYRENNRIEAKTALGGLPHSIWETYSAFANALGGIILLGVQEWRDKTFHLVDLPDPEGMVREFWKYVNDTHFASVNILSPEDVRIETVKGNHIILIDVPCASRLQKPVYIEDNVRNTFRRNGEGDYRCSPDEIRAMFRDAAALSRDMRVLDDLPCSIFNKNTLRRYRSQLILSQPQFAQAGKTFLSEIGAAAIGEDDLLHPTAAGLLMFGNESEIRKKFPHYSLNFFVQGELRLSSCSGRWSGNIADFYFRVCRQLCRRNIPQADFSLKEEPVSRAICGALANCLVHADYEGECGITVEVDKDEIRFLNPGCFRVEPAAARKTGVSDPRNSALNHLFNLIGIRKHSASGITGIYRVWKEYGREEPQIRQDFAPDRTTLILPLIPDDPQTNMGEQLLKPEAARQLVIMYLTEHISGTAGEMALSFGISASAMRKILNEMISENLVETQKSGRSRLFKLKA